MRMKFFAFTVICLMSICSVQGAFQYNTKGNQGWLTFDGDTTVSFGLSRSGKDKEHENFIDRGKGVEDYGWYNLDTGKRGSFGNGMSASFTKNDRIGLYVKDNNGTVYLSTKPKGNVADNVLWGKAKIIDGAFNLAGGNYGSNGTHEYYVFKVKSSNASGKTPSGQPLPGILAVLAVGGAAYGAGKWWKSKRK